MPAVEHEHTRVLFEGFAPWATGLFYLLGFTAIGLVAWGTWIQVRKYRRGRSRADGSRWVGAIADAARSVFAHRTLVRRDRPAGVFHGLIFYAVVLLFLGTATITLDSDIAGPLLGIHFWRGAFYLWFSLVMDLAGCALVLGLVYMMVRRGWARPPKLDYLRPDRDPSDPANDRRAYRREDWIFLWALLLIGLTGFALEGARLVWLDARADMWEVRWWSPIGALVALALQHSGLGAAGAGILRGALWWFHAVLALASIAVLPWTKAKHIFTATAALLTRDPLAAQRLARVPESQERAGARYLTDLDWRQLLSLDACTKCGRCHEACPARAAGAPLSPRDLILSLREFANQALQSGRVPAEAELDMHGKSPVQVSEETLWSCRTCMACVEICPVAVEHVPIIVQMRRHLVEDGAMDPLLAKTLQTIHKSGNSFGEPRRKRAGWTKDLPFPVKDARREPVDLLWFVGDYASFDPRNQRVTRTFAGLLAQAGVDFGLLHDGESNSGNDVRRVGEEGLYESLAEANIKAFEGARFQGIVTTDPHSYNTIRNEYPQFGGHYAIQHYTTLLRDLLKSGQLKVTRSLGLRVTLHDPCHLGRFNRGYDAPREILRMIDCELVEMGRCRDNSFCCGAGGGRIWVPDPVGTEKPSQNRMREAAAIPELEVFVVCCPKDLTMYEDALKTTGNEGRFVVRELIELVADAVAIPGQVGTRS